MSNLLLAVKEMLKYPYYKNYASTSGAVHNISKHEDAISLCLLKHGFTKISNYKSIKKNNALLWIDNPQLSNHLMSNGTFIEQPFGKQASPDFIIKINNRVVFLEAKSSKNTFPLYNSGGIHPQYLYVFCTEKTNETTIFKGEHIIADIQLKLIAEHIKEARKKDKEFNKKLSNLDKNNRGITYYTRPAITQTGGKIKTDYFNHKNRLHAEKRALDWISQISN